MDQLVQPFCPTGTLKTSKTELEDWANRVEEAEATEQETCKVQRSFDPSAQWQQLTALKAYVMPRIPQDQAIFVNTNFLLSEALLSNVSATAEASIQQHYEQLWVGFAELRENVAAAERSARRADKNASTWAQEALEARSQAMEATKHAQQMTKDVTELKAQLASQRELGKQWMQRALDLEQNMNSRFADLEAKYDAQFKASEEQRAESSTVRINQATMTMKKAVLQDVENMLNKEVRALLQSNGREVVKELMKGATVDQLKKVATVNVDQIAELVEKLGKFDPAIMNQQFRNLRASLTVTRDNIPRFVREELAASAASQKPPT